MSNKVPRDHAGDGESDEEITARHPEWMALPPDEKVKHIPPSEFYFLFGDEYPFPTDELKTAFAESAALLARAEEAERRVRDCEKVLNKLYLDLPRNPVCRDCGQSFYKSTVLSTHCAVTEKGHRWHEPFISLLQEALGLDDKGFRALAEANKANDINAMEAVDSKEKEWITASDLCDRCGHSAARHDFPSGICVGCLLCEGWTCKAEVKDGE